MVWALAVVHTLGAGTDATQPSMEAILLVTGAPIVFLFLRRILPQEPRKAPAPAPRPAGARTQAERLAAAEQRTGRRPIEAVR